jgi:hypothetical protein
MALAIFRKYKMTFYTMYLKAFYGINFDYFKTFLAVHNKKRTSIRLTFQAYFSLKNVKILK